MRSVQRWWAGHWRILLFDVTAPVVLLALGLIDAVTGAFTESVGAAPAVTSVIPGAIACLALLARRYHPLLALIVILLVAVVPPLILPTSLTYWDEYVVWMVALYSCARHLRRSRAFIALGLSIAVTIVLPIEFVELRDAGSMLFNSLLLVAAFLVGLLARSWVDYRARIERAAADRAIAEERASHAERARIARELHDVIAHTITVIVMQAGGARLASASDPSIAASTLAQIEELGRASLTELRSLLPLLQDDDPDGTDGDAGATPQPTLANVTELCDRIRGLGLPVTLKIDGDAQDVPLGLQLTAYRVVQEGLTNAVKHAGTAATAVQIVRADSPPSLSVEVNTRAPVNAPRLVSGGRGLAGLEERVRLAGGDFSARPTDENGFRLRVELPLGETA
jgi:signal transduction histidine kinase